MGLRNWIYKKIGFNFKTLEYTPLKFERFESLGNNCEIGLFLKESRNNTSSFFRYTFIHDYALIDKMIQNNFKDVFLLENLTQLNGGMVIDKKYNLSFHSKMNITKQNEIKIINKNNDELLITHQKELEKARYLANKFMNNLKKSNKIYITKTNDNNSLSEIMQLHNTMLSVGNCTMLNVQHTKNNDKVSTIEKLNEKFYIGYISSFAPYNNAHGFNFKEWYNLLKNANELIAKEK